ncbi:MAG: methyltransferase domain-containing protein [Streptosporangiaceae bacterium]
MTERPRAPSAVRTAVVWDALRRSLAARSSATRRDGLDVLDVGGGTGGFAVPLAELGHTVTVVDPSPNSLAALERRAAEADVTGRVRARQGDTDDIPALVGEGSIDLALCHSVLEVVDDPPKALALVARTLRRGGTASVLAANRTAAALHRALLGYFDEARRALTDPDGRWGAADPVPRRFTLPALVALVEGAGLSVGVTHGVRIFADLLPGGLVDGETGAGDALLALETTAAGHADLRCVATQLHVLGHCQGDGRGDGQGDGDA